MKKILIIALLFATPACADGLEIPDNTGKPEINEAPFAPVDRPSTITFDTPKNWRMDCPADYSQPGNVEYAMLNKNQECTLTFDKNCSFKYGKTKEGRLTQTITCKGK